jgi:hypothetical protein
MPICEMCETLKNEGWWGTTEFTHCKDCHYTWRTATRLAHCSYCHRSFTSPSGFDAHLKTGTDGRSIFHLDPIAKKGHPQFIVNETGAWYQPRPDDSYPQDTLSPRRSVAADESTPSLGLDTREPSQALKSDTLLSWLPKSR